MTADSTSGQLHERGVTATHADVQALVRLSLGLWKGEDDVRDSTRTRARDRREARTRIVLSVGRTHPRLQEAGGAQRVEGAEAVAQVVGVTEPRRQEEPAATFEKVATAISARYARVALPSIGSPAVAATPERPWIRDVIADESAALRLVRSGNGQKSRIVPIQDDVVEAVRTGLA